MLLRTVGNTFQDPLCGLSLPKEWFRSASPAVMARHWGSAALREFLLHPALLPHVELGQGNATRAPGAALYAQPGLGPADASPPTLARRALVHWERWKELVRGGDDPRTAAGANNLQLVLGMLGASKNDAKVPIVAGVLERWGELFLFCCPICLIYLRVPLNGSNGRGSQ